MAAKEIAEDGMIIPNNNQRRLTTTVGFKILESFLLKIDLLFKQSEINIFKQSTNPTAFIFLLNNNSHPALNIPRKNDIALSYIEYLQVLSSPGFEVRQKTLNLALDLVSSRNVEDMVMFLKKEIRYLER